MADIKKELNDIKNAIYGREVRGSIHDGINKINKESEGSRQIATNTEQRQDAVEQQFNNLLSEWSDERPIDNAETIAARTNTKESKTYENLGKRLDEEYGKVKTQLADKANKLQVNLLENSKADKTYVDNLFENLGQLEVKGSYSSVSDLTNAYPSGTTGLFEVGGSLYAWNGSEWKKVFELEVMPWADFLTEQDEEWVV